MGKIKAMLMEQEENPFTACPECKGSGRETAERDVPMSFSNSYGYVEDYERDCTNCSGMGEIERDWEDE